MHYLPGMPPVRGGGLIKYALDMAEIQKEMGEQVFLLTPGRIYGRNNSKVAIRKNGDYKGIPLFQIRNPLPISMANGIKDIEWFTSRAGYQEYFRLLQDLSPDIIHIHSLMGIHQSFFRAAKMLGIRIVFTTHDCFGLCPAMYLMKKGRFCEEKNWDNCAECCENAFGTLHLILDQSKIFCWFMNLRAAAKVLRVLADFKAGYLKHNRAHISEKASNTPLEIDASRSEDYLSLRGYYWKIWESIDCFHCNSELTKEIFEVRLGKIHSVVIPILNRSCGDFRKIRAYGKTLRIGFLGNRNINKGYQTLEETVARLWNENFAVRLNIYFPADMKKEFVCQHECYQAEDLPEVFDENDVIVCPSLGKETFGLVVAEALSYAVPVIVSENVGAKILLQKYPDVGKILGKNMQESLYETLKSLLQDRDILKQWNRNICGADIDFSFERHVREVTDQCYGRMKP